MNPVLIPLRNNLHLTKRAVRSVYNQDIPVELLVLDNASSDGTHEWCYTQKEMAHIHFDPPKSVAASWNLGLKFWFDHGAEYVLVVNNDIELRPDTYRLLIEDGGQFVTAVGTRDIGKILPMLKPAVDIESGIGPIHMHHITNQYSVPDPAAKRPHPDYSAFVIRREVWEKVGPFDECFKIAYCEDSSHHLRMHRAGIEAYCLDLPFLHHGAQTVKNASPEETRMIQLQADANRKLFRKMYGFNVGSPEYYAAFGQEGPPLKTD